MSRLSVSFLVFSLLTAFYAPMPVSAADTAKIPASSPQSEAKLLKVVALARHGVRAPVQKAETLAQWTEKAWPVWPVDRGELTPRGAALVSALWGEMRENLAWNNLLPDTGCPPAGSVYVYADNEQRTMATAAALLEGLAPGCGLPYAVTGTPGPDPLFHPVAAGLCSPAQNALPAEVNASSLTSTLHPDLAAMAKLTGPASAALCQNHGLPEGCTFADLPSRVVVSESGHAGRLDGGLAIGSSLAEIWLLEAAQWPGRDAAWGGLTPDGLSRMLNVHSRVFNALERAASVAVPDGSALLAAMTAALNGDNADPALNAAALTVFVGHDTSIAHVAALLGLHWKTAHYPADDVPPGSVLLLELWRTANAGPVVRATFLAQGFDALLSDDPQLLTQAAPERAELEFVLSSAPGSASEGEHKASLPLIDFTRFVETRLDDACLPR